MKRGAILHIDCVPFCLQSHTHTHTHKRGKQWGAWELGGPTTSPGTWYVSQWDPLKEQFQMIFYRMWHVLTSMCAEQMQQCQTHWMQPMIITLNENTGQAQRSVWVGVSVWVTWWYVFLSEPKKTPGDDVGEVRMVFVKVWHYNKIPCATLLCLNILAGFSYFLISWYSLTKGSRVFIVSVVEMWHPMRNIYMWWSAGVNYKIIYTLLVHKGNVCWIQLHIEIKLRKR